MGGTLIVCGAISGLIVWADLYGLEWYQRILYCVFLFAVVFGVLVIAYYSKTDTEKEIEKQTAIISQALKQTGHGVGTINDEQIVLSPKKAGLSPKVHTPSGQVTFHLPMNSAIDHSQSSPARLETGEKG